MISATVLAIASYRDRLRIVKFMIQTKNEPADS